ncbi:MAG: Abi family protein [Clostridia bacterium]|nr:Abi family protein [Clostridia bacterium]
MAQRRFYAQVKPARSYEGQIERLTDAHGLIVSDSARAKQILSTVNYYRLTTYGKHLRQEDDPERFVAGVSLDMLYALYQFDMGLRHAILPVLEFFEVQLRAKIAYRLAMTYGSLGYTKAENFRPDRQSQGWFKDVHNKFRTEVRRCDDLAFVRHHKNKYGGKFPIWAAVELFSFGMLGQLYAIMREEDQSAVADDYGMTAQALSALISAAIDVRNICAHYNRLYNQAIEDQPQLRDDQTIYESRFVFPTLLALRAVAGKERIWREMLQAIRALTVEFPEADLSLCGFPDLWQDILA